ncbi:MAG: aminocarboxymuconate-semialdehyde decarboxylase [Gammaproteobacteria bacterium]|jgi:aminocarboxymuconate-semialdehyde decarboxylase
MPDRRKFLQAMAFASAGGIMLGGSPFSAAQAARREVSIAGRRVKVVDMHAHCEIKAVERVVSGTPLEMKVRDARILGHQRLEMMDEWGIDIQALHVGTYWWFKADADLSRRITRVMNEGVAEWVAKHPDRFVGLGAVSLQHPELAAEELEYAVHNLGLRGASIGGHVNGEVPSSSRFDPFWAKVDELNVPVFVHPQRSEYFIDPGKFEGRGDLANIIGNPLETTMFLTRMIVDGTFDRHPGMKVVAAHGGGYLPSYSGRTKASCEARPNANCANEKQPGDYMKTQILVDSMVFTDEGLRHLVAEMGASQVVYGTDTPYGWPDTLDIILDASHLSNAEKEAILGGNLLKLLRIT